MIGKLTHPLYTAGIAVAALLFFLGANTQGKEAEMGLRPNVTASDALTPTVRIVHPSQAPNNLDTTITITGADFQAMLTGTLVLTGPTVSLGDLRLAAATWVDSTTLTATVPWGLNAGVYTVTVTNPGGGTGALPNAFTATQTIGVWTSGGPYGGNVVDLAMHAVFTRTLFAAVSYVGLFHSDNGGDTWKKADSTDQSSAWHVSYSEAVSGTLYSAGDRGLLRSPDNGLTWQAVYSETGVSSFALHPSNPDIIYISLWDEGVRRTDDGGVTWQTRNEGLTDLRLAQILADPFTTTILYAAGNSGLIFKSEDEGSHWISITHGLVVNGERVFRLALDPHHPETLWAMSGRGHDAQAQLAKSHNGGESWDIVTWPFPEAVECIAFNPLISGTLYAGVAHEIYRSTNGGDTWSLLSNDPVLKRVMITWIVPDPDTGLPLYAAGDGGFYRSEDGGMTWGRAVDGMTGIQPLSTVVAKTAPQQIFTLAGGDTFYSHNAGQSWAMANDATGAMALAIDPLDNHVAYAVGGWDLIVKTTDAGLSWTKMSITGQPNAYFYASSAAVHPSNSNILFVGGGDYWGELSKSLGWLKQSQDGGLNWQDLSIGHVISEVSSIVIDPVMTHTLYIGACPSHPWSNRENGSGIFKSDDGGITWNPVNNGLIHRCVHDLVIHPDDHQVLFAAINASYPGAVGIYKSTDGGLNWTPSITGLETSQVLKLAIDPLEPSHIYAATWQGLFHSTDEGQTWSRASGPFGNVPVLSISAAATGDRTFIYIGTVGGNASLPSIVGPFGAAAPIDVGSVQSGVYQQTIVHRPLIEKVYLPLVMRNR